MTIASSELSGVHHNVPDKGDELSEVTRMTPPSEKSGQIRSSDYSPLNNSTLCFFHFIPQSHQRVEIQIYRLIRIGRLNTTVNRCNDGHLLFGPTLNTSMLELDSTRMRNMWEVCGENKRFNPPLLFFADNSSTLVMRVNRDKDFSRSQYLVHFAFPSVINSETGVKTRLRWRPHIIGYHDKDLCQMTIDQRDCMSGGGDDECGISSPGHPGIYPPNLECKYMIRMPESHTNKFQIRLTFSSFNLPAGSCNTTHLNIFEGEKNIMFQSLCGSLSVPQIFLFKGQSNILLVFRSGPFDQRYINFEGFAATIQFVRIEDEEDIENDAISGISRNKKTKTKNSKRQRGLKLGFDFEDSYISISFFIGLYI